MFFFFYFSKKNSCPEGQEFFSTWELPAQLCRKIPRKKYSPASVASAPVQAAHQKTLSAFDPPTMPGKTKIENIPHQSPRQ